MSLNPNSFLGSCLDPALDSTELSVNTLRLPIRTGKQADGSMVAKAFIEGCLLIQLSSARALGFLRNSQDVIGVSWVHHGNPAPFWATLNFKTGEFRSNAPSAAARAGFGMLGVLAAMRSGAQSFRSNWIELLTSKARNRMQAFTVDNLVPFSSDILKAFETTDPTKTDGNGWTWTSSTDADTLDIPENVLAHLSSADDFLHLCERLDAMLEGQATGKVARFQGPQLKQLRDLLRRRKHTVLLGPPGIGKTISAFEALEMEGYKEAGVDFQLFTGHDEVKSSDFLGGWQPTEVPGKFVWVNGCLVRAMTANNGEGQPILVEEFTRMPTRSQNMFISALSDGYVILNEKPSVSGVGEVVKAGPNFVLLADMNVDAGADDIELFGAAFATRVRKLEYDYPTPAALLKILENDVPTTTPMIRAGITFTFDAIHKSWAGGKLPTPVSPRACVQWAEEIMAILLGDKRKDLTGDTAAVREAAKIGANLTWMRDVAGTDKKIRKDVVQADIEASFRKAFQAKGTV